MTDETIIKLSSYSKKIIGVKEASGNVNRIVNLRNNTHDDFLIISGDDFSMIDAVRYGADGIISVAANAYPNLMNSTYIRLLWEDDDSKPKNISDSKLESSKFLLNNFFELIFKEGSPSGIKFALSQLNLCKEKVRLPLTEISSPLRNKILEFLANQPDHD